LNLEKEAIKNMETDKKNYLFRLGPLIFFPKDDTEEKRQATKERNEKWEFFPRFLLILALCKYTNDIFRSSDISNIYISTEAYSIPYFIYFFCPLLISIMDVHTVLKRKKEGIPTKPMVRYSIYGLWLVSALFYAAYIYIGLLN
jgi:hypothetical protein